MKQIVLFILFVYATVVWSAAPTRREAGAGYILRDIGKARIVNLVDSSLALVDAQWRTAATTLGVQASRYWLFTWPEAGEVVTDKAWSILLPVGLPPIWKAKGFATFDAARPVYYDWRLAECGKAKPTKPYAPGQIGDKEPG